MRMKGKHFNQAMRIGVFLMAAAVLLGLAPAARAAAGNNNLKIVGFYGAGNLSKSEYTRDTVILFNPTQAAITMNGWSLQVGSTAGSFTTVYKLPVATVPAGGWYAIAGSGLSYISGSGCTGVNCQASYAYDYVLKTIEGTVTASDNDLSSTGTEIALVSVQTQLGSGCGLTNANLVDLLVVSAADGSAMDTCHPGGGAATYTPSTFSYHGVTYAYGTIRRNKCVDTYNNAADFTLGYIDFENSSSTPDVCPTGNQLWVNAVATPNNPAIGTQFTITAQVTPATNPNGTISSVTADLSNLGLSSTAQLYDDGTHGDAVAGDGIYSLTTAAASGTAGETLGLNVTATDNKGNVAIAPIAFSLGGGNVPGPGNNNLRIVAWYGAGNLSKSQYGRDTVILFNPTQSAITMSNWSLQTGGSTGAFSSVTYKMPVVTIPAGSWYAIAGSGVKYISSSGCTSTMCNLNYAYDYQLKTVEGTATTSDNDLSSTAVVAALVNNQTALGSNCPLGSPHLVDLVGVGASDGSSPVTCYLGGGYAPYTPGTLNGGTTNINGIVYAYGTVRKNKCINSWDNAQDFMLGFIDFENSATSADLCPTGKQLSVTNVTVTPSSAGIADPITITAKVTPATIPSSSNLTVTADLSNIGLSSTTQLYDDGTHGDATAGDGIYSLSTAATSGTPSGSAGWPNTVPGLIVTASDSQGNTAQNLIPLVMLSGSFTMTTPTTAVTLKAGDTAKFPLTIQSVHGYHGILEVTCTGTPNQNTLGIPISTQCVATPPELTITPNGKATISLAIATGSTVLPSGLASRSLPLGLIGLLAMGLLTVGVWRRKHLFLTVLLALVTLVTMNTTACGTASGIVGITAAPGTYTYTVTATDSSLTSVFQSVNISVTVQ